MNFDVAKVQKTYKSINKYITEGEQEKIFEFDWFQDSDKISERKAISGEYSFFYDKNHFLNDPSNKPLDRQNYCLFLDDSNGCFCFQLRYGKSGNLIGEKQKKQKKKDDEIRQKAKDAFDKIEQICSLIWPGKFKNKINKFEKNDKGKNGTIQGVQIDIDRIPFDSNDNEIKTFCQNLKSWHNQNFEKFKNIVKNVSTKSVEEIIMDEKLNKIKELLLSNHNIILHGAPGTGKTYLAKEIAKKLIFPDKSNEELKQLSDEEQKQFNEQCGFVQFHQSYDYTDFVEGLRPVNGDGNQIGFKREDGIFKKFCGKAFDDSSIEDAIKKFKAKAKEKETRELEIKSIRSDTTFKIKITEQDAIAVNDSSTTVSKESIKDYIENSKYDKDHDTYAPGVAQYIIDNCMPKFVFIIDEVNRGEMSKIFGELFYSIDPGYRGKDGSIKTQYANLQQEPNKFDKALGITKNEVGENGNKVDLNIDQYGHFFVPKNVYIIGTMNDIDRSVESMDFAMRRRFAFKEINAADTQDSMFKNSESWKNGKGDVINVSSQLETIKKRMNSLNGAIVDKELKLNLGQEYQIGGAYFLKFANYYDQQKDNATEAFNSLWINHLEGVLREYLRGMDDSSGLLEKLKKAYYLDPEYIYNDKGEKIPSKGKTQPDAVKGGNGEGDGEQPEETKT